MFERKIICLKCPLHRDSKELLHIENYILNIMYGAQHDIYNGFHLLRL